MRKFLVWMLGVAVAAWAAHAAAAPAGKMIVLTTAFGTEFDAYVSGPEDAPRAVLILHDRFGFNSEMRRWADRLAERGYRALAIDLYDGRNATNWKHATSVMRSIDPVWADSDIDAAIKYLSAPSRKLVVMGWDFGGQHALLATLREPEAVSATIIYYGNLVTDATKLQTLVNPVLVIAAERDEELSLDEINAFKEGLSKTRVDFNVMGIDAGRGFTNPLSSAYDKHSAALAWETTQEFLDKYIGR